MSSGLQTDCTIKEAARVAGVPHNTLRSAVSRGVIPHTVETLGGMKFRFVSPVDVERWKRTYLAIKANRKGGG